MRASCHAPLSKGHGCRAYIHHLLDAREMLATMLLDVHNTHHLQRFFAAIRASLRDGTFAALRGHFRVGCGGEAAGDPAPEALPRGIRGTRRTPAVR